MRKYIVPLLFISTLLLAGCDMTPTADQTTAAQQENLQKEAIAEAGLPNIVNFQEKKLLKMIYELRDQANIVDYAYLYSQMTGKLVFLGKCIGYGIPYSTQYSNPEKIINLNNSGYGYSGTQPSTIPEAEPNGLFPPSSAAGTWIMLINPVTNQPQPIYAEPDVIVSPFPLTTN